jgi:hypothetical protein
MKAYKYEVSICEGALELSHGWSNKIKEIWIPDFEIIFNEKNGAFSSKEPRNRVYSAGFVSVIDTQTVESPMEEIDLDIDDARMIAVHIETAGRAKETIKKIFDIKDEDR